MTPSASLVDRVVARFRSLRAREATIGARRHAAAWQILLVAGLAAAIITGGALWQAAAARAETHALLAQSEAVARDRERVAALAKTLALPPLDATLAALRAHLPPDVRLAEAARDEDGGLEIAIDAPDPDALRAALAADAWLAGFRERGQAARDDGTIRVRLAGKAE
ncbi:hypothetical protein Q4F19_04400 [Sphingomonas sp. BIUV-7]|uniref:Uncharacterized protein n=1 Tax=Sphingomonas natans TaxID=3063330 RepID=A0ABT8Y5L3_9SPHN|nr:hypothetical protein [Sphingomonas sp. BIUV-7]